MLCIYVLELLQVHEDELFEYQTKLKRRRLKMHARDIDLSVTALEDIYITRSIRCRHGRGKS